MSEPESCVGVDGAVANGQCLSLGRRINFRFYRVMAGKLVNKLMTSVSSKQLATKIDFQGPYYRSK